MLQMIFALGKCERKGPCENGQPFQRPYTPASKQKMSIKASNYYLISWRFKATETIAMSWLEVLK